jgi:hypothetical protein
LQQAGSPEHRVLQRLEVGDQCAPAGLCKHSRPSRCNGHSRTCVKYTDCGCSASRVPREVLLPLDPPEWLFSALWAVF